MSNRTGIYTTQWWYDPQTHPPQPRGDMLVVLCSRIGFCVAWISKDGKSYYCGEEKMGIESMIAYSILPKEKDIESRFKDV
jgi:hypothetical protein